MNNNGEQGSEDTLRCAETTQPNQPLKVTTRPIPEVPGEGVLLRTLYAGICRSDLHFIDDDTSLGNWQESGTNGHSGDTHSGAVLGHEICGVVDVIGKEVPIDCPLKVGYTVIVYPWRGCRQCEACSANESHLCENNAGGATDIGRGKHVGGFSDYVAVPEWTLLVRVRETIPPQIACLLPCCGLTAYASITKARPNLERAVRMRGRANLLVIGTGGVGTWCTLLVKCVFCDKNVNVICADVSETRLEEAAALGADDVILWDDTTDIEDIVAMTTMGGYNKMDAVIDFVGTSRTQTAAFRSLHHGGAIVVVGLYGGQVALPVQSLVAKSVTLHGQRSGSIYKLRELVDLLSSQQPQKYPMIEYFRLDDVNSALDKLRRGELKGRAVLQFPSES